MLIVEEKGDEGFSSLFLLAVMVFFDAVGG
jgi:hypothetical protein